VFVYVFIYQCSTTQGTPLSRHVGNGQTVVNGDASHSLFGPGKFDSMVENLVLVKETAEGDNYILTSDTRGENTSESDFGNRGGLKPGTASGPDTSCVGSYNRGSLETELVFGSRNASIDAT